MGMSLLCSHCRCGVFGVPMLVERCSAALLTCERTPMPRQSRAAPADSVSAGPSPSAGSASPTSTRHR